MSIAIKKLTPDLAEDYAHFFDVTPHNDEGNGTKCYCVTWRSDESYAGNGDHWFPTEEERRDRAIQFVKSGSIQGYLAYNGDKIVGWCNASADYRLCVDYLRSYWPIDEYDADIKIKSVFCFAIAPEAKRTGVATKLLEHICQDAASDGFNCVESYIYADFSTTPNDFRGSVTLYEKCGFTIHAQRDDKIVMRKALKEFAINKMAACGIDCAECDSYKTTVYHDMKSAEGLVEWYKGQGWIGSDEGAEAVMKKNPLCKGCWNSTDDCFFKCGCHHSRDFRVCCTEKQIDHCGECKEFPCKPYTEFVGDYEHHIKAMEYLLSLRQGRKGEGA